MTAARTATAALLALGCSLDAAGKDRCTRDDQCLAGRVCVAGICRGGAHDGGGQPSGPPGGMVQLTSPAGAFWIDVYEASLAAGGGDLGGANLDSDGDGKIADRKTALAHARSHGMTFDEDEANPGAVDPREAGVALGTAMAASAAYRPPLVNITFWQAAAACANAGKRLCTSAEWQWACSGAGAHTRYPYGNDFDGADQPGSDCWTLNSGVNPTGSATACVTPQGVYDMSGNVEELTNLEAGKAQIRGGWASAKDPNDNTCGSAFGLVPVEGRGVVGFRCCRDP